MEPEQRRQSRRKTKTVRTVLRYCAYANLPCHDLPLDMHVTSYYLSVMIYETTPRRTRHLDQRMNRRGISKEMIGLVCEFGDCRQDKYVLGRDKLDQLIAELSALSSLAKRVRDKGGMVVVEKDGAQLTTYNLGSYRRAHR